MKCIFTAVILLASMNAFAGTGADYSCAELKSLVVESGSNGLEIKGKFLGITTSTTVFSTPKLARQACAVENYAPYCHSNSYVIRSADKFFCTIGFVPRYDHAAEH